MRVLYSAVRIIRFKSVGLADLVDIPEGAKVLIHGRLVC